MNQSLTGCEVLVSDFLPAGTTTYYGSTRYQVQYGSRALRRKVMNRHESAHMLIHVFPNSILLFQERNKVSKRTYAP